MDRNLLPFVVVGAGAALGGIARYTVSLASARLLGVRFPYGTLLVNLTGSFLLGVLASIVTERLVPQPDFVGLALGVGFLGGYTTFSTFTLESQRLLRDGEWLLASLNVAGSVFLGLVAVRLGMWTAGQIGGGR